MAFPRRTHSKVILAYFLNIPWEIGILGRIMCEWEEGGGQWPQMNEAVDPHSPRRLAGTDGLQTERPRKPRSAEICRNTNLHGDHVDGPGRLRNDALCSSRAAEAKVY